MKDGFYLQAGSYTYYGLDLGDVYERELWLEDGLVLTDDGRALIRTPPHRPNIYENERYIRIINGERFRTGRWGNVPVRRCRGIPSVWTASGATPTAILDMWPSSPSLPFVIFMSWEATVPGTAPKEISAT